MQRLQMGMIMIVLLSLGLSACSRGVVTETPSPQPAPEDGEELPLEEEVSTPLTFSLSEGVESADNFVPSQYVQGEPLTEEELASLLKRLPALESVPPDTADFNLPDEVIPPPRPGETLEEPFPPEEDAAAIDVEYGTLEVLRYSPEGEIPIAPFVNITSNQPMVPLMTIGDLSEMEVPVHISPALPGTWRWLGTKTLNFQYDSELVDRLPMATEYEVLIPAGIESAVGGVLAESVHFRFNTPALKGQHFHPWGDPQPLEPLFFISFDQRINPVSVLEHITVNANGHEVSIQLATKDQIAEDERISHLVENARESRYVVFRTYEPLPADADITVTVEAGAPSAEGPLLTTEAQSYSFYTYAPLKITDHYCGWSDTCRPLMPLTIEFNNPIDAEIFNEGMLEIFPEIPGASVDVYGDTLQITGMTAGRTTYKVKVRAEIADIFGQTLMRDETVRFAVGPAKPFLIGPDERFITLDPASSDVSISLFVMNYNKLDVQIYRVQPSDWQAFLKYLDEYRWTDEPQDPPGKLLLDETRSVDTAADILSEVQLDLSAFMDGDFAHFIAIVKPHKGFFEEENYWETVHVWAQVTQIGLDAFYDHSELVVWASALSDGAPLSRVRLEDSDGQISTVTGKDGIARIDLPDDGTQYLLAQSGDDVAMLPYTSYYSWEEKGWIPRAVSDSMRWFVYDDRAMYRPGEEVHLKGWIRQIGGGQLGDVGLLGDTLTGVSYSLIGAQGNEITTGRVDVNLFGGFDIAFTIPEHVNLGYVQLNLQAQYAPGQVSYSQYTHTFQIQEFRRPEFEVSARNETEAITPAARCRMLKRTGG